MMAQFNRAKREQPDALLFFRMGDFYELFGEDAVVASRELGITLTSRDRGDDPLPMAGVPIKAYEAYLMRLVRKGYKVAICEQMQDPRTTKGIVERAIVRVVTAGTITEEDALDARANNFLASVFVAGTKAGLAWVDVSTGRFQVSEVAQRELESELGRIGPAEVLCSTTLGERFPEVDRALRNLAGVCRSEREDWRFDRATAVRALSRHFKVATVEGYGLEDGSLAVPAAGALIEYLEETQRSACEHVRGIERVETSEFLVLDRATRACLELVATQREGRREGTLLETLDATLTPMGGRLLREWLLAPLRKVDAIVDRQRGVGELVEGPFLREDVRELLRGVLDVERLVAKVSTGRANARDLVGLANSLAVVPRLRAKLEHVYSSILGRLLERLDPLDDVTRRIHATLVDAPPLSLREGGMVRPGFSAELDELLQIAGDGKSWMARFQADEIARTGMSGLKVGFNSVFGYFLEVPRGQIERVPESYIRKQTVKNAERYITPELKEFEGKVLKAEERSRDLEYEIFSALREEVGRHLGRILDTAAALATLDVLAALAQRAAENRYVAPTLDNGDLLSIEDGRHPVIERMPGAEAFVPNDSVLDREARRVTILTGPNMAGKSTYIRQTALIVLLAQIGSFVPARKAKIGVADRIFTRVGAADDISRNASTFMVEMIEVANILNNASARSLVVFDEVGRGTSTFDGLALAWAIVEHVHERIGCRTLFATHYHQLTELAARLPGVCNKNVAVREYQDEIVFLHKIVEGGTDRSYGIHVARLAGVPKDLIERAKSILRDLEADNEDLVPRISQHDGRPRQAQQLSLFAAPHSKIESALAALDPDKLSPIEALLELKRLRELL
ncbi:MAG: DNA mismatch repair protein MutS [Planctomycetes bacterium]|nr:DNA mismatch repair protein MutS [Planctomycetota bacterium]